LTEPRRKKKKKRRKERKGKEFKINLSCFIGTHPGNKRKEKKGTLIRNCQRQGKTQRRPS